MTKPSRASGCSPAWTSGPVGRWSCMPVAKTGAGLGEAMHTNFKLGIEGEYLGLYSPELPRLVVDEIAPVYPEQRSNISYGRLAKGD